MSDTEQLDVNPIDGSHMTATKRAVILLGIDMYELAMKIRGLKELSTVDALEYLVQPMKEIGRQLEKQITKSKLPAIEKPTPSVIQRGEDKAADFLRAANSDGGVSIHVKQFEEPK